MLAFKDYNSADASCRLCGGAQTTRANLHLLQLPILQQEGFLQVRPPLSLGVAHGEAYVVTGEWLFATNLTLCHNYTFLFER